MKCEYYLVGNFSDCLLTHDYVKILRTFHFLKKPKRKMTKNNSTFTFSFRKQIKKKENSKKCELKTHKKR